MRGSVRGAFVGAAAIAAAPTPGRLAAQVISGRVVNAGSGLPVVGAPVRLLRAVAGDTSAPADTTALASGATAGDGVFLLAAPGSGTYRARIGDVFVTPPATFATADSVDLREYRLIMPRPSGCGTVTSSTTRELVVRAPGTLDSIARTGESLCAFQVEKQAATVPGTLYASYPSELRECAGVGRGTSGRVVVQFVVDTTGRAQMPTLRVLQATDAAFVPPVRAAVARARFYPAEVARRPVRQLVQLPFAFQLDGPAPSCDKRPLFGPPFKSLPAATGAP